jgi:cytoskeletal protein CcmA (bactofilin family)
MFSGKKSSDFIEQVDTLIGKDTNIKGNIEAKGTIRFDGHFEGDISTAGAIIVGETGNIKAQIKARTASVAGAINGNMIIAEKLELLSTAKIYGDIKVGMLIISEGAVFKGACEMKQEGEVIHKEVKNSAVKS